MESEAMEFHSSEQRAMDIALWMTFKYRKAKRVYGIRYVKRHKVFFIEDITSKRKQKKEMLSKDYSQMTYEEIKALRIDSESLKHWEDILGMFSTTHGEILRFLLHYQVPLEKLIRYELACRGFDENHEWAGFTKAEEIWLK